MARKKSKFYVEDPLISIPSYIKTPERIFENIEHYRCVAERVTKALLSCRENQCASSSLYESVQVEFSSAYKEEDIYFDACASKIILRVPKRKGESAASIQERRMNYIGQLLCPLEAMKVIGIAQIYLCLKDEGRKKLSKKIRSSKGT